MWMRMRANHPRGTRTNQLRLLWVELSLSGTTTQPGGTTRPGTTAQPGGTTRPGTTTQPGTATRPGTTTQPENNMGVDLRQRMRMAWLNHITLVKFYLISFFENLSSQNAWKDAVYKMQRRFLRFCSVLSGFSNAEIPQTFMEHLRLTDEVAAGLKADPAFREQLWKTGISMRRKSHPF